MDSIQSGGFLQWQGIQINRQQFEVTEAMKSPVIAAQDCKQFPQQEQSNTGLLKHGSVPLAQPIRKPEGMVHLSVSASWINPPVEE